MMGRKKGSKNKPKEVQLPDGVTELPASNGRPEGFAIDVEKYNVPPFPDDWDKMGKIARLEWLTAHPRKK